MRRLLREAGFAGRSGRLGAQALLEAAAARGAVGEPPRVVAEWTVTRPPRAALEDWADKDHLAGTAVPEDVKARVLSATARFTRETFGNIDEPLPYVERYTLEVVRGERGGASTTRPPSTPEAPGNAP
jgi:hypothetical protein